MIRKAKLLEKVGRTEEARTVWNQAAAAFEKLPAQKRETKSNQALAKEIQSSRSKLP
jgi:alpha-ketoglutarate-dependent taurine dioxygenase